MSGRELVVLGTASQTPTRDRAQHGALLRWDDEAILFDPGEGTQRQLTLAGVPASAITRIAITHAHGDHCLGLPGVLARMALDGVERGVDLYFPAAATPYMERLQNAAAQMRRVEVRAHPVSADGPIALAPGFELSARALDHRIPACGYRLQEPDGRSLVRAALDDRGISGPDVGRLVREGQLTAPDGRVVTLEEVSAFRAGQAFAFVMDTRRCQAALDLARGVDMLVSESTFLARHADLADAYGHLTAGQAAAIAAEAGARRLVLTHFSARYADPALFAAEAGEVFGDVHACRDLDRISVPPRHPAG
jgi:ribonuclease Z